MLNIVIPMAGRGSRFAEKGYFDPKPLIPIGDKRMIEVVVNNLKPKCEHRFIFVCQQEHLDKYNYKGELDRIAPGCEIIGIDGITEGAACTVMYSESFIDNDIPLMIANSDQWIDADINDYLDYMQSEDRIHRLGLAPDAKPQVEFVECEDSIDQVVRARLELKVRTMAQALEDSSLSVEISSVDYDEEAEDYDSLTAEDAKAVIDYFFSGGQND